MAKINLEHSKNEDAMKLMLAKVQHRLEKIKLGGGAKKIERQHDKGKMTARERIDYLIDDGSDFFRRATQVLDR